MEEAKNSIEDIAENLHGLYVGNIDGVKAVVSVRKGNRDVIAVLADVYTKDIEQNIPQILFGYPVYIVLQKPPVS